VVGGGGGWGGGGGLEHGAPRRPECADHGARSVWSTVVESVDMTMGTRCSGAEWERPENHSIESVQPPTRTWNTSHALGATKARLRLYL